MELTKNYFYILQATACDGEKELRKKAAARSNVLGAAECNDAVWALTKAKIRLESEMDWFLDCGPEEIETIRRFVEEDAALPAEYGQPGRFIPLTRLNLFLLEAEKKDLIHQELHTFITEASGHFDAIRLDDLEKTINTYRQKAGLPQEERKNIASLLQITYDILSEEIEKALSGLSPKEFAEVAGEAGWRYFGDARTRGQALLGAVLEQYLSAVKETLEKAGDELERQTALLREAVRAGEGCDPAPLLRALIEWHRFSTPLLQTKSQADMQIWDGECFLDVLKFYLKQGKEIRDLQKRDDLLIDDVVDLYMEMNDTYGLAEEAIRIAQPVYKLFGNYPFEEDLLGPQREQIRKALEETINENYRKHRIAKEMLRLEIYMYSFDDAAAYRVPAMTKDFLDKTAAINKRMYTEMADPVDARTRLCRVVRETAERVLRIHDDGASAARMLKWMMNNCRDLPEFEQIFETDVCPELGFARKKESEKPKKKGFFRRLFGK